MDLAAGIGARIRTLRERSGIQSQELASKLGMDPSAMSNIERGKRAVKTEELAAIAAALGVSPLALLSDDSLLGRLPVAPRAQAALAPDGAALARLTALAELNEVLAQGGIPPEPHLQGVPVVDTVRWLASANALAEWARKRLSPPSDSADRFSDLAESIEEELGIDVLVESCPGEELAGACITDWSFPFILVNQDQPRTRAVFTLAHEVGHVLSKQADIVTLDVSLAARSDRERLANAFAASFLMPKERVQAIVEKHARSIGALATMLTEFGVSLESLVYRLHNLGFINAAGRDQLRARGWTGVLNNFDDDQRRKALLEAMGTRPEHRPPGLLTERVFRGYQRGVVSVRPLAGLLGEDEEVLLDKLVRDQDSRRVLEGDFPAEEASDEERYSGSPI
jgi:Zn-dependent peptidase ImmA (M78 family)/transcriptional regulator with XRE-family HTH domain